MLKRKFKSIKKLIKSIKTHQEKLIKVHILKLKSKKNH